MDKWTEHDYPEDFDKLPVERQNQLLFWISENLIPRKTFNTGYTSYGIKHLVKIPDHDSYFTNGQFKGAMLKSGYQVKDKSDLNWVFNVSQKSQCFNKKS